MSQVSDNVTGPSLSAVAAVPCDATSAGGQGLVRMTNGDDISALHVSDSDTIMPIAGVTHTDKNFHLSVENYLKSNYDKWWSNSMVKWHSGPKDLSGCTRCQTNQVFDNWTSTGVSDTWVLFNKKGTACRVIPGSESLAEDGGTNWSGNHQGKTHSGWSSFKVFPPEMKNRRRSTQHAKLQGRPVQAEEMTTSKTGDPWHLILTIAII